MELAWKVILWIIPLFFLFFFVSALIGGGGLYEGAKSTVKSIYNSFTFGIETENAAALVVPKEYQDPIGKMKRTIEITKDKGNNCFRRYSNGDLIDLSKGQTSLVFEPGAVKGEVLLRVLKEGTSEIISYPLGKMELCVVEGAAAGVFYNNFITPNLLKSKGVREDIYGWKFQEGDYNHIVNQVIIQPDHKIVFDGKSQPVDLEDGGWMFFPSPGKVCFFPTTSGWASCQLRGNLLDNDCFDEDDSDTISYFIGLGLLNTC